jgi:alkaline phosphatase
MKAVFFSVVMAIAASAPALAQTRIQIVPPGGAVIAAGQRFDLRVEATGPGGVSGKPPSRLEVSVDGQDITSRNELEPGEAGERGAGGTGKTSGSPLREVVQASQNSTNFLVQDYAFERPGTHTITARTADGATAAAVVTVTAWQAPAAGAARARNIILMLGDGMGAAHRTAARIVSRGVAGGRPRAPLAMDRMPVTGQVMTGSLNSIITDSAPGMASYVTGHKSNNNQEGVYPDNNAFAFDNPRVEYLGELLRRVRGPGFNVGIVTTADVTDATPAANAVHTADRAAGAEIANRFLAERGTNAVSVLLGGGRGFFLPEEQRGRRTDGRDMVAEYRAAGFDYVSTAAELNKTRSGPPPVRLLGLFHSTHMSVAFDKVGAGKYSQELALPANASLRDQPMLDDMARAALAVLDAHSPQGFYLMIEGASIDKQAHAVDAERTIWDTIEFDNAVAVALAFAERTNTDADPDNDTLVIVTADHECGGLGLIGVGNPRYAPETLNAAVRDYASVFRFTPTPDMTFFPDYRPDANGYPQDPDPPHKLLLGWAAGPDRFENWLSNRLAVPPAFDPIVIDERGSSHASIANPARDGGEAGSDNASVRGVRIPGFLVAGTIENGASACETCGDSSVGHLTAGHTAADVPLSAYGPGMEQFTGTYDNTDVFLKLLRAAAGSYSKTTLTLAPAHPGGSAIR